MRYWVKHLNLDNHPEGGFYKETYRSDTLLLPENETAFDEKRNICTGIYFLITKAIFQLVHRIKSDEMWHFTMEDLLMCM
jgi:predicted cupin superfamily sugar epimerase